MYNKDVNLSNNLNDIIEVAKDSSSRIVPFIDKYNIKLKEIENVLKTMAISCVQSDGKSEIKLLWNGSRVFYEDKPLLEHSMAVRFYVYNSTALKELLLKAIHIVDLKTKGLQNV